MSGHHSSNVGALDAAIRIILGVPIVIAGPLSVVVLGPDWWAVTVPLAFMVGALLIITATLRYDPSYAMMDISTARAK